MGMGQLSMMHYRFQQIDYLSYMYQYQFLMASAQPKPIASYETLFYPFDWWTWLFCFVATMLNVVALIIIEISWRLATKTKASNDAGYEGDCIRGLNGVSERPSLHICLNAYAALALSWAPMLSSGLPEYMVRRRTYETQKFLLMCWLLFAFVVSASYKSTLLSTLIPIRYSKTIETLEVDT